MISLLPFYWCHSGRDNVNVFRGCPLVFEIYTSNRVMQGTCYENLLEICMIDNFVSCTIGHTSTGHKLFSAFMLLSIDVTLYYIGYGISRKNCNGLNKPSSVF